VPRLVWLGDVVAGAVVVTRSLAIGAAERAVDRVLRSREVRRILIETLERPELERLLAEALDSRAVDRAMAGVIERVADSPEVRRAIAQQSVGLADEVAEQVRTRAAAGDDVAERLARRLLRRRP
jgi:pantoate kinase